MGTRALFSFKDEHNTLTVYKHWDGYPEKRGAYGFIAKAVSFAWELPRFEADDFAAAFVAANKKQGGGDIRLTNEATTNGDTMGIEYWYTITAENDCLKVECRDLWNGEDLPEVFITKTGVVMMRDAELATAADLPL